MQRLEVSGAVRPIYESLGVKRLITTQNGDGTFQNILHVSRIRVNARKMGHIKIVFFFNICVFHIFTYLRDGSIHTKK